MAGGSEYLCRKAILAKYWDAMLNDPLAVKHRWYCKICASRYKTRFGVLTECIMKGIAQYCYAELPPLHMYDAKGMMVERTHPGIQTPENLYEAVPSLNPAADYLLVPTHHEGHYKNCGPQRTQ